MKTKLKYFLLSVMTLIVVGLTIMIFSKIRENMENKNEKEHEIFNVPKDFRIKLDEELNDDKFHVYPIDESNTMDDDTTNLFFKAYEIKFKKNMKEDEKNKWKNTIVDQEEAEYFIENDTFYYPESLKTKLKSWSFNAAETQVIKHKMKNNKENKKTVDDVRENLKSEELDKINNQSQHINGIIDKYLSQYPPRFFINDSFMGNMIFTMTIKNVKEKQLLGSLGVGLKGTPNGLIVNTLGETKVLKCNKNNMLISNEKEKTGKIVKPEDLPNVLKMGGLSFEYINDPCNLCDVSNNPQLSCKFRINGKTSDVFRSWWELDKSETESSFYNEGEDPADNEKIEEPTSSETQNMISGIFG